MDTVYKMKTYGRQCIHGLRDVRPLTTVCGVKIRGPLGTWWRTGDHAAITCKQCLKRIPATT